MAKGKTANVVDIMKKLNASKVLTQLSASVADVADSDSVGNRLQDIHEKHQTTGDRANRVLLMNLAAAAMWATLFWQLSRRLFKDEHDATSWAGGAIQGGTQAAFFLFNGLMYLWDGFDFDQRLAHPKKLLDRQFKVVIVLTSMLVNVAIMGQYGWKAGAFPFGVLWFHFVASGCSFTNRVHAPQLKGVYQPWYKRDVKERITVFEWLLLQNIVIASITPLTFDIIAVAEGQYDSIIHTTTLLSFGIGCLVTQVLRWRRFQILSRKKRYIDFEHRDKLWLYMSFCWIYAGYQLLRAVCMPDAGIALDPLPLPGTPTQATRMSPRYCFMEAYGATLGSALFFFFHKAVSKYMIKPFVTEKFLEDGSYLAEYMSTQEFFSGASVFTEAKHRLRRIPWSRISLVHLDSPAGADKTLQLSEACQYGHIDFFVSHSWHDSPDAKYERLREVSTEFMAEEGREPTFWIDKYCIDVHEVERDLRCLPIFMRGCKKLLILGGETYASRLWCAWELYVYFAVHASGEEAAHTVKVEDCVKKSRAGWKSLSKAIGKKKASNTFKCKAMKDLRAFNVRLAKCSRSEEEKILRDVIAAEGESKFNEIIRDVTSRISVASDTFDSVFDIAMRGLVVAKDRRTTDDDNYE